MKELLLNNDENIATKGEIAHQKSSAADASERVCMFERVKTEIIMLHCSEYLVSCQY